MKTVKNLDSTIYYKDQYWNDIHLIIAYMSKNFTGNENKWWTVDFKERYGQKSFNHALFLNCGDGGGKENLLIVILSEKLQHLMFLKILLKEPGILREKEL